MIDGVERALVAVLYVFLVGRIGHAVIIDGASPANLLLLLSEGMVLAFVLVRRKTDRVSRRVRDWFLALAATCTPMLLTPSSHHGRVLAGSFLIVLGMLVQIHAKWTLGRSVGCVPANRGLVTSGPYRFVRHPMYLGYRVGDLGFVLMNPSAWNVAVYVAAVSLQLPRIAAEEALLAEDPEYRAYMRAVPDRLLPLSRGRRSCSP